MKNPSLFEKSTAPDYWEKTADAVVAEYKRLSAAMDAAAKAGCMDTNGPLFDAVWRSFDGMMKLVDRDGWITWFVFENDCGAKGMSASVPGKAARKIRTTKQLARIIRSSA